MASALKAFIEAYIPHHQVHDASEAKAPYHLLAWTDINDHCPEESVLVIPRRPGGGGPISFSDKITTPSGGLAHAGLPIYLKKDVGQYSYEDFLRTLRGQLHVLPRDLLQDLAAKALATP